MFKSDRDQYTWWSYGHNARENNVGMRLDYFFVSKSMRNNLKNGFIMSDILGSDHCPIGIELKF